jgi:hypothetical protein
LVDVPVASGNQVVAWLRQLQLVVITNRWASDDTSYERTRFVTERIYPFELRRQMHRSAPALSDHTNVLHESAL